MKSRWARVRRLIADHPAFLRNLAGQQKGICAREERFFFSGALAHRFILSSWILNKKGYFARKTDCKQFCRLRCRRLKGRENQLHENVIDVFIPLHPRLRSNPAACIPRPENPWNSCPAFEEKSPSWLPKPWLQYSWYNITIIKREYVLPNQTFGWIFLK